MLSRPTVVKTGSLFSSFEKIIACGGSPPFEEKRIYLSLIRCCKISASCPCTKLFISSSSGTLTVEIVICGNSSCRVSLCLFVHSRPASSPFKKKMISFKCGKFCKASLCSSFNTFVPNSDRVCLAAAE